MTNPPSAESTVPPGPDPSTGREPAPGRGQRVWEFVLWGVLTLAGAWAIGATKPWEASAKALAESDADWLKRVDGVFGAWLVKPQESLVFHSLGTESWLTGTPVAPGKGIPLIVAWLFLGAVFFTVRMGFVNFRAFGHALRLVRGDYDRAKSAGEVSHFQALSSALSGTVGLGNIAGVAIAVGTGGPGAVFWMILGGIFGMSSKFTECTLGMLYRRTDAHGHVTGGPMIYLRDGLAGLAGGRDTTVAGFLAALGRVSAVVFALMCIGGACGGGGAFQVSQSLNAISQDVPLLRSQPWIYGVVLAGLTGIVIIGGIRRIAVTAEKIVPLMCGLYLLICGWVLIAEFANLPAAVLKILSHAWSGEAIAGGFWGVMVIGIQRAAFSNEAGVGSASIAHSAARTDEPVSEGLVALLEPFIDTVIICTCTGLVMVLSGVCDDPAHRGLIAANEGANLTRHALAKYVWFFPYVLSAVVFLFAYSTMISWSYYGERCVTVLCGPAWSLTFKLLFLVFLILGSIVTPTNIKDFSDLMILSMALPNILGAILLSGLVKSRLDDYLARLKSGEIRPTGVGE